LPHAPYVNQYEVAVGEQRAEAEDLGGALTAVATLINDAADAGGNRTMLRRSAMVYKDGRYDGIATTMAQSGYRL
jgi:hypothetical protein